MTNRPSSSEHIDAAAARLAHLGALSAHTDSVERNILAAAEKRLEIVEADLSSLRPRVNLEEGAASRYQELVLERGNLNLVIARAKEALP